MEQLNWLQSISVGVNKDKSIIKVEFFSSTKGLLDDKSDECSSFVVPVENYNAVIRLLIKAGKQIEKDLQLNLHIDDKGDDYGN
ncbi:MAG: hypothetical protein J6A19_14605 [Oscillospiraceae bacterium]|nr:hypothetical protein [Oscillospiraceae bacterium]